MTVHYIPDIQKYKVFYNHTSNVYHNACINCYKWLLCCIPFYWHNSQIFPLFNKPKHKNRSLIPRPSACYTHTWEGGLVSYSTSTTGDYIHQTLLRGLAEGLRTRLGLRLYTISWFGVSATYTCSPRHTRTLLASSPDLLTPACLLPTLPTKGQYLSLIHGCMYLL